jgi:hypothetical protein
VLFWLEGLDTRAAHATSSLAVEHPVYALGLVRPTRFTSLIFYPLYVLRSIADHLWLYHQEE